MQWRGSGFVVLSWWYLVAAMVAAGVLIMGFGDVRAGGRVMAAAFAIGAVIRYVAQPARKAGGLNVRSRASDVTVLLLLAIGVLLASATVKVDAVAPDRTTVPRITR